MAFQRIRIKRSNVAGKVPGADKLDVAELCVNLKDQKLYSKDADGNVFELGGKVDSGITPPPGPGGNNIGDLFWDGDFLLVWNGNEWVPVGAADLDYTPAPDKGTITNTAGDDVDLPLVDDTNAGLMSPDEHKKLDGMPVIISGDQFPGTPELGDIWIDTNLCPPSINIWNDCEDPGNPDWTPIGGGDPTGCQQGGVAIAGDTEIGSTLTATGGRGLDAGELLPDPIYTWTGPNGFTATGTEIVATEEGNYTVTATITCLDGTDLETSATKTISDSYVDMVNNTSPIIAVLGELPDGAYSGNSLYVATNATVNNGDNPVIVENRWYRDSSQVSTDQLYTISAADPEGSVLTCRQLFRDARTNEILSDASNGITIVARPADAITFTAVITDDGTPNANTPGHVLTASAQNIIGGTAPIEYEYKWLVEGLTMGANKTLNIIQTFVGKIVSCEVTVAEPDGTNPETRTAVYSKVIEIAGTINTPEVLAPADGAGSGDARYLKSDAITEVEGGGIKTCETDLIQNVSDVTSFKVADYAAGYSWDPPTPRDRQALDATIVETVPEGLFTTVTEFTKGPANENGVAFDFGQVVRWTIDKGSANPAFYASDDNVTWKYVGVAAYPAATAASEYNFSVDGNKISATSRYALLSTSGTGSSVSLADFATIILTFPSSNGFDCFEPGDVVQGTAGGADEVKIISKDADAAPPTITVDGGEWAGSDGSGTPGEQTTLVKETPYDTKLTVAGSTDLADMTGSVLMTDGTGAPGPYSQTPYKLVTTDIESVNTINWTETGSWNASGPGTYMFDGKLSTFAFADTNNSAGVDFQNVIATKSLRVYGYAGGLIGPNVGAGEGQWFLTANNIELMISGGSYLPEGTSSVKDWVDLSSDFTFPLTLNQIRTAGSQGGVSAIEIDGALLTQSTTTLTFPGDVSTNPDLRYFKAGDVVQGSTLPTQIQQKVLPFTSSSSGANWDNGELVDQGTYVFGTFNDSAPGPAAKELLYDIGISSRVSWKFFAASPNGTYNIWGSNDGTNWTQYVTAQSMPGVSDAPGLINSDNYRYYRMDYSLSSLGATAYSAFATGEPETKVISTGYEQGQNTMTVDGGTWAQGDVVEYQTNGGQGDIVSVNTDDNTLLIANTGDRDNRWIIGTTDSAGNAGNSGETGDAANATDFFVAGPSIVDRPLLTADVELKSTDFATTPDNADTLKNIVWELNGTEQNAGLSNPYKPTLGTDTTYTVRVKHQGNALDDSEWSASTTFTTGATRNLYTYYKERVELLESRLSSIEADEVNDDATDTVLINTVANLIERIEQLEGGA